MAALLGIDVDRTISITFIMGAALAAVAGTLFLMYYGVVVFSDGFVPGVKAFTAAVLGGIGSIPGAVLGGLLIGFIESHVVGLFLDRLQGRRRLLDPGHRADLPALRHPRPAGSRKGLSPWPQAVTTARDDSGNVIRQCACAKPLYAGLISFGLFFLLIGLKTDQNIRNELILVPALGPARHRRRDRHGRALPVYVAYRRCRMSTRAQGGPAQGCRPVAASRRRFIRRNFNDDRPRLPVPLSRSSSCCWSASRAR